MRRQVRAPAQVFQNELAPAKAVRAAKSAADGAGISLPSLPSFGAPSLPAFKAPSLGLTLGTLAIPGARARARLPQAASSARKAARSCEREPLTEQAARPA